MLVAESIEFCQDKLDTSIETYLKFNALIDKQSHISIDNAIYLIIMKHLIKFLQNHQESALCEHKNTYSLISKIKSRCYISNDFQTPNFITFKTEKYNQFNFDQYKNKQSIDQMLIVWFLVDSVIETTHSEFLRGEYGRYSDY